MINLKIKVQFSEPMITSTVENLTHCAIDDLNWNFIKGFSGGLETFLEERNYQILDNSRPFILLNQNSILAGYSFSLSAISQEEVLKAITDFLSAINHKDTISNDFFNNFPSEKSLTNFLKIRSGKKIKHPLNVFLNEKKFLICGKFTELNLMLDEQDIEYDLIAKVKKFDKTKRTCFCSTAEGLNFNFYFDEVVFFPDLIRHFAGDDFSSFKVLESKNAKGKKILKLLSITD